MVVRKKKLSKKDETKVMTRAMHKKLDDEIMNIDRKYDRKREAARNAVDEGTTNLDEVENCEKPVDSADLNKKVDAVYDDKPDPKHTTVEYILQELLKIPSDLLSESEKKFVDIFENYDSLPTNLSPKYLSIASSIVKRYTSKDGCYE